MWQSGAMEGDHTKGSRMQSLEQRIRSVKLSGNRKGYDRAGVDGFLDTVADEVAVLLAKLRTESVRVGTLERELTILQGSTAGEITDVFLSAATAKGKLLDDAYVKAEAILEAARQEAENARTNSTPGAPDDGGVSHVEQALEEARAIEMAAIAIADRIKSDARVEADKIVAASRALLTSGEPNEALDAPELPLRSDGHAA